MKITEPCEKYLQSYYEACIETWGHTHDNYILHNPDDFYEWKNHIFEDYKNAQKGINLPDGYVPLETFWIINNEEYIGTINFRAKLNDKLRIYGGHAGLLIRLSKRNGIYGYFAFKFIKKRAEELKINPLILTCEEENTASWKLIEHFKPIKQEKDTIILKNKPTKIRRYFF